MMVQVEVEHVIATAAGIATVPGTAAAAQDSLLPSLPAQQAG